ncbi:MAG: glycine betaine ABC transporter substrate-binding protein [Bacteriovoracia bacterium]
MTKTILTLLLLTTSISFAANVTVGSKTFTESYILGEIFSQVLEDTNDATVQRRFGLGGTGILYQSLIRGSIDLYPEYTDTISQAILKDPNIHSFEEIQKKLDKMGLIMSEPLGFDNTYALAVRREFSEENKIYSISDLKKISNIRTGFGHEFVRRPDGLPGLLRYYQLNLPFSKTVSHSLGYQAIANNEIDLMDVYTTDAKIAKLDLYALRDDRNFFPKYSAVILARKEFVKKHPDLWSALTGLEGKIRVSEIVRLNGLVDLDKKTFSYAAKEFLEKKPEDTSSNISARVLLRTKEHIQLVFFAIFLSLIIGIPAGIISTRRRWLGQCILLVSGVLQTVPSLALLCFLIPVFGIGTKPALAALFLYSLLPIITGTTTGLQTIDPRLIESAKALGLSPSQRLRMIEIPLASRNIMAGIRTSTIISIGTATLSALIGAGGYGAPIVTGLALNDIPTILTGAIPAAVMALIAHFFFEVLSRIVIPRGIR